MKKFNVFTCFCIVSITFAQTNDVIYLWPNKVPNEISEKSIPIQTPDTSRNVVRITNITNPKLTIFKPTDSINNHAAVIISPGGGYSYLAINIEGYEIAEWFNSLGFTAFVLEYRTPDNRLGALNDIQRSIKAVRSKAEEMNLNPNKIGVIGFSAGGNLSLLASTSFKADSYVKQDAIDLISSRPDFSILMYPSSLTDGENNSLSSNINLSKDLPPIFLFGTSDDSLADGFFVLAKALKEEKANFEFHLLPKGGHGYGLRKEYPSAKIWPKLIEDWLTKHINIQP